MADQRLEDPHFSDISHLTSHELRHTYSTLLFKSGTDAYVVQRIMSHKTLEITMDIYDLDDIEDVESRIVWPKAK